MQAGRRQVRYGDPKNRHRRQVDPIAWVADDPPVDHWFTVPFILPAEARRQSCAAKSAPRYNTASISPTVRPLSPVRVMMAGCWFTGSPCAVVELGTILRRIGESSQIFIAVRVDAVQKGVALSRRGAAGDGDDRPKWPGRRGHRRPGFLILEIFVVNVFADEQYFDEVARVMPYAQRPRERRNCIDF